jgi:DNA-binding LacI/PurR family transcriptional regulator
MAKRRLGAPTLEAVAAHAGVGRGTVSRVINNAAGVKESTRQTVQRAIEELGYVPNLAARSLAGQRADAVALVLTEPDWRQFAEPFFSEIVRSLGDALADTGMQLTLTLFRSETERQRFLEYARGGRVDGVLLMSVHADGRLPDMLAEARLPTVLLGRRSGDEYVSYVDADNVGGARNAVSHLLKQGRTAIATITGPLDMYVAQCRLRG